MQGKIQKHQAFEAELDANENRISAISAKGQEMVDGEHEKSQEIIAKMDEIKDLWQMLQDKTKEKGSYLVTIYLCICLFISLLIIYLFC